MRIKYITLLFCVSMNLQTKYIDAAMARLHYHMAGLSGQKYSGTFDNFTTTEIKSFIVYEELRALKYENESLFSSLVQAIQRGKKFPNNYIFKHFNLVNDNGTVDPIVFETIQSLLSHNRSFEYSWLETLAPSPLLIWKEPHFCEFHYTEYDIIIVHEITTKLLDASIEYCTKKNPGAIKCLYSHLFKIPHNCLELQCLAHETPLKELLLVTSSSNFARNNYFAMTSVAHCLVRNLLANKYRVLQ